MHIEKKNGLVLNEITDQTVLEKYAFKSLPFLTLINLGSRATACGPEV